MSGRIEKKTRQRSPTTLRSLVRGIRKVIGPSRGPTSSQRRRDARREARRKFRHAVRKGAEIADRAELRARARAASEKREKLPLLDLHILAAVEGVYLENPCAVRKLAQGLIARLSKIDGSYYFLAKNGYYYKSMKEDGLGADLDFVVDTWVPLQVRILAKPYRQLCYTEVSYPCD